MKLTRRSFLKASAAAAVMTAAGVNPKEKSLLSVAKASSEVDKWTKAPCRFCGTGCGVLVGVKDGKVVAVKGDKKNPVNKGFLCIKGYSLGKLMNATEDRLKKPMIRKNGKMVETDWETALDLVAKKYRESIDTYGPDSVAVFSSGQSTVQEGYVLSKLMKGAIGTNNLECNARLCMASAVVGYLSVYGKDEPMGAYADFEETDLFFIIGANMAECHPILYSRVVQRKRKGSDVKVIVADPRETRTNKISDLDLAFKPGTDTALLNAMAYVIIEEDLIDEDFINSHTNLKQDGRDITLNEFKEFLAEYTPQKAAKITGLDADDIVKAAKMFADPKRESLSLWTMGVNQQIQGVPINQAIHNLHLLTGKICRPGSSPLSLTGQPSACGTAREVGTFTHKLPAHRVVMKKEHREEMAKHWGVDVDKIPPKPSYHTMAMFEAINKGDINALWVTTTNPAHSLPNFNKYRQGLEDVFLVVSDVYPTETTKYADVILPSAMWVEKEGFFGNTERRTQHFEKAVDAPGEAKPDLWQFLEVARRLGYGELFPYKDHPEKEIFEEYRKCTLGTGKDLAPYDAYRHTRGLTWPVVDGKETTRRYVANDDPYVKEGIEFYGKPDGKAVIYAREYTGPAESADKKYPFILSTGRVVEHWHTATMTMQVPELKQAVPEAYVEIHKDDARRLGIKSGDMVKLISRRGELKIKAKVGGRGVPQPKMLFVPFFDSKHLINLVTKDAFDPQSKEPEFKICAVKVEKA
ncbi:MULTISPECIES: molybdopterin-dependent oxidoreductase [unclassified Candidatus Frackibacter]|uniref:molybdopterin-dependent oxidoreductase n=1 Tax=unclassified Candidatus Frackibacter TaxID=2648818 RepID=UPI000886BDE5|nr:MULTISPECIES: molybdopterin-dependent oxidoreductase [unclassified Candidatus Frackibacter]SDC40872.1 periplasmic nitrate reductase subunit NapA apoprotein [Candidatus Frackibacter sp. WG11]SEM59994.1 periplasmic nitrate reductase subunit NapA apoprotein [Candidatus Frackibacter sp. WG12]SFL62080.1 periplasmic nitrate reductase subunit NapA apoprotein [Candidatus Frackibacter sp. WG13]